MLHDVIMPALGMAQDTGLLVAWHKNEGDAVSSGEVLFEVETDKSTMEVEAQADGFLSHVKHGAGEDVPVGQVIAQITKTAQASNPPDTQITLASAQDVAIAAGEVIIMPALGMTQDSGLIVAWRKNPGDTVRSDDVLFEVETDKSTMEVEAGHDGYLAAVFYPAGTEAPVGTDIAVISSDAPTHPLVLNRSQAASPSSATSPTPDPKPKPAAPKKLAPTPRVAAPISADCKILASPKARRLAMERGLDFLELVKLEHPQPYHVADLDVLENLKPTHAAATPIISNKTNRLTAKVSTKAWSDLHRWSDRGDGAAVLADFALNAAPEMMRTIVLRTLLKSQVFDRLGMDVSGTDPDTADLCLLDLREAPLTHVDVSAAQGPVLAIIQPKPNKAEIVLEYTDTQLDTIQALCLITDFVKTLEQPLRRLL